MTKALRHISDAELEVIMRPRLISLHKGVVPAAEQKRTSTHNQRGQKRDRRTEKVEKPISELALSYLRFTAENELLTSEQRRNGLGLSTSAAHSAQREILDRGLVVQVRPNLGKQFGGTASFLIIKLAGWRAIGQKSPWPPGANCETENPSGLHAWWARNHMMWGVGQGYDARMEYQYGGKRTDVVFLHGGKIEAHEIEFGANGIRNILASLQAGYTSVTLAAKNSALLKNIRSGLDEALSPADAQRVKLTTLPELPFVAGLSGK